jgi:hypothetical protein
MVQGWVFTNTTNVDFDFAADPGNASATDLIVLERGDPSAAQTVRLARVKGAASTLATVTQSAAVWQIALARVPLSAGGLPTGLVDVRRFANQVMSWRQGGSSTQWGNSGTTNYLVGNVNIQAGSVLGVIASGDSSEVVEVTYPVSFSGTPVALGTLKPVTGGVTLVSSIFGEASTLVRFIVETADGVAVGSDTTFVVHWFAVGNYA